MKYRDHNKTKDQIDGVDFEVHHADKTDEHDQKVQICLDGGADDLKRGDEDQGGNGSINACKHRIDHVIML